MSNEALRTLIARAHVTYRELADSMRRIAVENGDTDFSIAPPYFSRWIQGATPYGMSGAYLAEALSRRLGRAVTVAEIGFPTAVPLDGGAHAWRTDTLVALSDLSRREVDDVNRRQALRGAAAYSLAAISLPPDGWWETVRRTGAARRPSSVQRVGVSDVTAVRRTTQLFLRMDQRYGGGHARSAVQAYLTSDVYRLLRGVFVDDATRTSMARAASELAYTRGWMHFDNGEHAEAQEAFHIAMSLAAEADDAPLAGHILRAMAHQAIDLGHGKQALDLANNSVDEHRYARASPREKALIGVVQARALASTRNHKKASEALLRAEDDLAAASDAMPEPDRVFFFAEASLAHETACTLRDMGDLPGAEREFIRSIRTRDSATFTRTHLVTLGYLGDVQMRRRDLDRACATWTRVMDGLDGIQSNRTRDAVATIHASLHPIARRASATVRELDQRASAYLRANPKI